MPKLACEKPTKNGENGGTGTSSGIAVIVPTADIPCSKASNAASISAK